MLFMDSFRIKDSCVWVCCFLSTSNYSYYAFRNFLRIIKWIFDRINNAFLKNMKRYWKTWLGIHGNFADYIFLTPSLPNRISKSPHCLSYNSCDVGSKNLSLDQLKIPLFILFLILITNVFDILLILWRKILSGSLMKVKGLNPCGRKNLLQI